MNRHISLVKNYINSKIIGIDSLNENSDEENIRAMRISQDTFRIVFDGASKFQNVSLNSMLLKGADLNQPLLKLPMNFRIGKYVVCADIKEIFNQIAIRKQDQPCQRFLWRHGDSKKTSSYLMYIMTIMLFGASCSSCSTQYVKIKNATGSI